MTLKQLDEYRNLITQVVFKEEQIKELRDMIGVKSPSMTGMPRASGISDKVGNAAIEIADLEMRLEYQRKKAEELQPPISEFINEIDDDQTRLVFRFRVMYGYSWSEVAEAMGRYNTKDSVRKRYFGYMDKIEETA